VIAAIAPVWFTARAAGVAALLLATGSVTLGLLHAGRVLPKRIGPAESRALHEALALATLAAIALHGVALLLDPVLKAGVAQIVVPLASPYKPVGTALGQLAGYGMAVLGLGYYARRRIGPARWRSMHRFVPAFWLLALLHGLTVGTDRGRPWLLLAVALPALAAGTLLIRRWVPRSPAPATASRAAASRGPAAATSSSARTATPPRARAARAPRSRPAGSPRPVR
jgi:methionine sulfoxide reductase heme-binding subunit